MNILGLGGDWMNELPDWIIEYLSTLPKEQAIMEAERYFNIESRLSDEIKTLIDRANEIINSETLRKHYEKYKSIDEIKLGETISFDLPKRVIK